MRGAIVGVVLVVVVGLIVGGCILTKLEVINPGNVGVSVKKCGDTKGVSMEPIPNGYYWRELFCEEVIEYPTNLQTLILTKKPTEGQAEDDSLTVNSSEGMPVNVDVALNFTLDGSKVPAMYAKFRADLDHIKHAYVKQTVREALKKVYAKYTTEQLAAGKQEEARAAVQETLSELLKPDGFVINQFTVNETRVPDQVRNSINAKVAMIQDAQKAEQEVRKTQAYAAQRVAQAEGEAKAKRATADAEAYFNKTVAGSITPQLVQMRQIEAQMDAIKKWDGKMPQVAGGNLPFIMNMGK